MRYAVYFTPEEGSPLAHAGASWLGRDALSGSWEMMPEIENMDADRQIALTDSPRRYGFHATLKAPFVLREGFCERDLLSAVDVFASETAPAPLSCGLHVASLGGFIALMQAGDDIGLNDVAAAGVERFEAYRAPLTDADLARRRKQNLTAEQDKLLVEWGYPYVFDQFRFHMTLSQRIENEQELAIMKKAAEIHFDAALAKVTELTHISLFQEKQPGDAFFKVQSFQLKGPVRSLSRDHAQHQGAFN